MFFLRGRPAIFFTAATPALNYRCFHGIDKNPEQGLITVAMTPAKIHRQ
jgi:glutamine phosphoribosylpyrophosphate amidotransferase